MAVVHRRGKFGAIPSLYRGERYDSRGEAEYARHLDLLQAAGRIREWRRGRKWLLLDAPRARDRVTYTPDFEVVDAAGNLRVLDYKGVLTDVFKLKAKMWRHAYPGVPLYIVKADGTETLA